MLHTLKTITFAYDLREDRILAAINIGLPEAWSSWLTRRLALALLERAADFIASKSALVQRASAEVRSDVVAFEREAGIAKTATAMSPRPAPEALKSTAESAELLDRVNVVHQGESFRVEFRGNAGGGANGVVSQAELQRILQMLRLEVGKTGWTLPVIDAKPAAPVLEPAPKPFRH